MMPPTPCQSFTWDLKVIFNEMNDKKNYIAKSEWIMEVVKKWKINIINNNEN